jgi:hypothetical protein
MTATAIPTTTICQTSPVICWRFSEKRGTRRRGSLGVDIVTAQGSFLKAAIFGHTLLRVFHMLHMESICATYVSWRSRFRNPRP